MKNDRRTFIKKSALGTAGMVLGAHGFAQSAKSYKSILGANDRINFCVIGTRSMGFVHLKNWASMAKKYNIQVKTICEVDETLFPERVEAVEKLQGAKPETEYDMRNVFDDKEIDAVSIATPNHWHALATIWAVQAGKDVYVEKPCSHNIFEGRKMIEAAGKYKRIVQAGFHNRSIGNVQKAMEFLHSGGIGEVYMAKGLCYKPRNSFGISPDEEPPKTLHYDLWLGPAAYRPYNEKKGHYNWHWHWDTGNGDIGNQGAHQFDIARWGINKNEHPVKVSSTGGYYKFGKDECSQETPNTQTASLQYADGKIIQFEVRGLSTGGEANDNVKIGNLFYGTEGWLELNKDKWQSYLGQKNEKGLGSDSINKETNEADINLAAPSGLNPYINFVNAIRSRKPQDLNCEINEGYFSTVLPLLSNISYRLGRNLVFDGGKENFGMDNEANKMLSREYRKPFKVKNII